MRSVGEDLQRAGGLQNSADLASSNESRRMFTQRCTSASALMSFVSAALLIAGQQAIAAPAVPKAVAAAQAPQSVDAFRQEADKLGVRQCASLFSAMGQSVTLGSTYAVQVQADSKNADKRPVQGVAGITYNLPDLQGQAAGIVMAAPVGNVCEGQLVRVAPFQKPCAQVVGMLPQGSTAAGTLSGVPLYNLAGNQGQAMMITSGQTCVVVTIARLADAK